MSHTEKMIELLRQFKPQMNGAVAAAMQERGVKYGLNYGVSLPTIKQISAPFAPDHSLAQHLFRQDVRELKIAAIYIDNPEEVTAEQMNRWAESFGTDEVAELCDTQLFFAAPSSEEVAHQWIEAKTHTKAALQIIGKRAATKTLAHPERALEAIIAIANTPAPPINSTIQALCKIASISPELEKLVRICIGEVKNGEIRDEVLAFL